MSIATLAARVSKADRRRHAARAALKPLRRVVNSLLSLASQTRKILYQTIDKLPTGAPCRRKYASRRQRRRTRFFESLLFGEAPRHSIVPRRHAALEPLEAREMLYNPTFSVNSGTVAEGGSITFNLVAKGFDPYSTVGWGAYNGSALAGTDYLAQSGDFQVDGNGNGSKTVTIETSQDGPTGSNPNDQSDGQSVISFAFGGSGEGGGANYPDNIDEEPTQPRFPTCNCGCGVVEASADRATGAAMVGDGLGAAPGAFSYNSYQRPHPIVDVLDTLSSTVNTATNIETQLTLQDLNGNVVWTGAPVYYSSGGYTQGQQVVFAGQIDATGLADGTYQRVMTVTENYPNGQPPIIRTYGDWVGIENRDNSPYGSGWTPHNIDRLVPQTGGLASGASLEDGSGNVYWFVTV